MDKMQQIAKGTMKLRRLLLKEGADDNFVNAMCGQFMALVLTRVIENTDQTTSGSDNLM